MIRREQRHLRPDTNVGGRCDGCAVVPASDVCVRCAAAEAATRSKRRVQRAAKAVDGGRHVFRGSVIHGAMRSALVGVCAAVALCSCASAAQPLAASPIAAACGADPRAHVYNPDRLQPLAACVTVTGTIERSTPEPDGDYHIRLRLDTGQSCAGQPCTNGTNGSAQHGDLVLEPVCEHGVTQPDAVAACVGYRNALVVPPVGTHVSVTGPWVLDSDHGWNEIHPLEAINAG